MSASIQSVASVTTIIATLVTTVVVLAGAPLAFEKLKNQPRLAVNISGEWVALDRKVLLHVKVNIINKSNRRSRLILEQRGTGLRVSSLVEATPSRPALMQWTSRGVFGMFADVSWLEPKERWSNDVLIDLDVPAPVTTLLEARFVWRPKQWRAKNLETSTQQIIPANVTPKDST